MRTAIMLGVALLTVATAAAADVRGPEGDRGFRYVYPAVGPAKTEKLYKSDLKAIAAEGQLLENADGGELTADHRAYLETRRTVVDRRYAEALGQDGSQRQ